MKRFLFGFDTEHPEECARMLRRKGIDAVVMGDADERTQKVLADSGLELYLCYGAHGLGDESGETGHLARDAEGQSVRWFSSGCPNDAELTEARLDAALEKVARMPHVRGLMVDGARFASFASGEGTDGFFSCFCPRCVRRMADAGFDPERIRRAVLSLKQSAQISDPEAIADWFRFREICVSGYFERFAQKVHALPGRRQAGAFVFAPSLAGFVGQTPAACAPLDFVSPMLYRAYPHPDGPACLDHEWAEALRLFGPETLRSLSELSGGSAALIPQANADQLLEQGLPPARIGAEVSLAREQLGRAMPLLPIVQIDDECLLESVFSALLAGADGFGYFMFGQAPLENLPKFL